MHSPGTTIRLASARDSDFHDHFTCIFSRDSTEPRGRLPFWDDRLARIPERCSEIQSQDVDQIVASCAGTTRELVLKETSSLSRLFLDGRSVYLDISGLAHHVWAPIVRAALAATDDLRIVYAEPDSYRPHQSPTSAAQFDLSSAYRGVEPIPSFARLRGPERDEASVFVPLLGFEGIRARQVAETLDPVPDVIPIVGVPGFRLEYPFVTVASNLEFLDDYDAFKNIRLARASCPFEAYSTLMSIRKERPDDYMYIAPIGTKPHALGAVWFAIDHPYGTELMYDHPTRKAQRTAGVGVVHVYRLKGANAA